MSKIRVAYLGTGGISAKHSKWMKDCDDVEIVAGCDVSADQVAALWKRTWGDGGSNLPAAFTDPATMYAESKPDAVVICTPHTLHYEQAMQALDAGCHILLEKPMVTRLDHAYKLRDAVDKAGKVFCIAYNTPCSGEFYYLRECIRNNTFGKLDLVAGYLSQNWRKATKGSWRQDPAMSGGGQAYDSGAHLLNSLCWSIEADVEEVFAFVDHMDTPVDINSAFTIKFANGVLASIAVGGNSPGNGADLHYMFDQAKVDIDGWGGGWINVSSQKYPPITPEMNAGPPAQNFVDAILGKAEPRTSPYNGIVQSQLMDCIYESARTGRPAKPGR